jgi:hypothetical protein
MICGLTFLRLLPDGSRFCWHVDHSVYMNTIYRVNIKSFPDYKLLLQEYYVEYKHIYIFFSKCDNPGCFFYNTSVHFNMCSFCIPCSFLVINVCNQGRTLCWPCISAITFCAPLSATFFIESDDCQNITCFWTFVQVILPSAWTRDRLPCNAIQ